MKRLYEMNTRRLFYLLLFVLLAFFTFTYGVVFFPTLDADNAIQVIMIDHLKFPEDLYYMGQDRIGSIIPAMGWLFYQLGTSPLWAVTLTQTTIFLIIGFVLIRLFKDPLLAFAGLLILIFPLSAFEAQVLPGQPYPGHLFILFLAILAFRKYQLKSPIVFLFLGFGLWASEIFIANIAAAGFIYLFAGPIKLKSKNYGLWILRALLYSIPGFILYFIAKRTATTTDSNYTQSSVVEPLQFVENLKLFLDHLYQYLSFSSHDIWMSISLWLFFILLLLTIPLLLRQKFVSWSWFFILSGTLTVLAILLSEWAFRMGLPLRYFSIGYLQILWGLLLCWDDFQYSSRVQRAMKIFWLTNAGIIAISGLFTEGKFAGRAPGKLYADTTKKLAQQLETEGILGSYWHVYLTEAFNPEHITSLVNQEGINRDYAAMKRFLELDTITIIKNSFVDELSPVIYDHGVYYYKTGPSRKIDDVEFATYYKPENFLNEYSPSELLVNYGLYSTDSAGKEYLHISADEFSGTNLVFYGPYLTLPAGIYEVCFNLTVEDTSTDALIVVQKRMEQILKEPLMPGDSNPCYEFTLEEPAVDVEFRMDYFGKAAIDFKSVHLKRTSLP